MAGTSPAMTNADRGWIPGSLVSLAPRNDSGPVLFHERARWLHVQRERVDLVAGARIYFGDDRIVPGDDTVGMARKTSHDIPALEHVAKIIEDRKRAAAMHVGIVIRRIRRQHHRAASRLYPHHPQAGGMAAY